jgi:chromosome segregation ATPase
MTVPDIGPPAAPNTGALGPVLKSLEDLARRFGQAGESESARLIREAATSLRDELARRDGEVAELRRLLATTREAATSLRDELARRDGEVAELRRLLATTRAYVGILS